MNNDQPKPEDSVETTSMPSGDPIAPIPTQSAAPPMAVSPGSQTVQPQKSVVSEPFLGSVAVFSLACAVLYYAFFFWLSNKAKDGAAGLEFIVLAFWPVLVTIPFLIGVGLIAGIVLVIKSPTATKRLIWGAVTLLLVCAAGLQVYGRMQNSHKAAESNRLVGRNEMVSLIRSCKVDAVRRSFSFDGSATIEYAQDAKYAKDGTLRSTRADGAHWNDYIAAAQDIRAKCGEVIFIN
jgi:hypothetical protein